MIDTKFTPGPWWVEPETGDVVAKDGDWEVCTFSRSDSKQEHDTNLIAAAPELYSALEEVIDLYASDIDGYDHDRYNALLKKARGES